MLSAAASVNFVRRVHVLKIFVRVGGPQEAEVFARVCSRRFLSCYVCWTRVLKIGGTPCLLQ